MLTDIYLLPFSMLGATSSEFISPYSPFSNSGEDKGSTGEYSRIEEAPSEKSVTNNINDSLAASLSYLHRLVKG